MKIEHPILTLSAVALAIILSSKAVSRDWGTMFDNAATPGAEKTKVQEKRPFDSIAVALNGRDEYLTYDGKVISSYPFTLAAWLKTSDNSEQAAMGFYDSTSTSRHWQISYKDGRVRLDAANPQNYSISTSEDFGDGKWHYVVAVFSSSNARELYVDGVSLGKSHDSVNFSTNGAVFSVGRSGGPKPGRYFHGKVDEISVWNTSLTPEAIASLYESRKATNLKNIIGRYTQAANLAAWWRMGDSGSDDFALHLKDSKSLNHLKPVNLDPGNASGDIP